MDDATTTMIEMGSVVNFASRHLFLISFKLQSQWASRCSIWWCCRQTNLVSCWIDCQKFEKGACLGSAMVLLDAVRHDYSKTGLGSVVCPLDAEFWATAWFSQGLVLLGSNDDCSSLGF